ncbi:MAG: hypothetical protein Kow0047_25550 [Anaerolineae bacterium]
MTRPWIAVTIGATTNEEARRALESASQVADAAELRLDYIEAPDLPALLTDRPCPVIVTCRAEREGGRFHGDEQARIELLRQAIALGAEHVDVEWDTLPALSDIPRDETRLIVSHHDFTGMPLDFADRFRRLSETSADIVKLVGMAHHLEDLVPVIRALSTTVKPAIAIAMGTAGVATRILALRYKRCYLTYAALEDPPVAPGQVSAHDMEHVFYASAIDADTVALGVIGEPDEGWAHLAAANEQARTAGLNAVWVPLPPPRDPSRLSDLLDALDIRACQIAGALANAMSLPARVLIREHDGWRARDWDDQIPSRVHEWLSRDVL